MSRKQQPFWKPKSSNPPKPVAATEQRVKIMIAVFTSEERHGWIHPSLMITIARLMYDPRFIVNFIPIHSVHPVCAARNLAVRYFLETDSEVLVLFDNDVAPHEKVNDAIVSMPAECNIAVLPYWVWLPNEKHTMPCFGRWEDGVMIIPDPTTLKPGWQEMGAGGTGCMFIRRKVFTSPEKLQAPFFKIISTSDKGQVVSEDVYFTGRAAEAGFPTWINTDYICSHFHTINLADVNFGTVNILRRFQDALEKKYGESGIKINTLIQELHPELLEAAKGLSDSVKEVCKEYEAEAKEKQDICRQAIKDSK